MILNNTNHHSARIWLSLLSTELFNVLYWSWEHDINMDQDGDDIKIKFQPKNRSWCWGPFISNPSWVWELGRQRWSNSCIFWPLSRHQFLGIQFPRKSEWLPFMLNFGKAQVNKTRNPDSWISSMIIWWFLYCIMSTSDTVIASLSQYNLLWKTCIYPALYYIQDSYRKKYMNVLTLGLIKG